MSGTVVISVDAELGWGYRDVRPFPVDRIDDARPGWRSLVDLFDRFDVPATWAIVGRLFVDRDAGGPAASPEESALANAEEWRLRPDFWFGNDLVTEVLDASVDHDVGCHTYSHVDFRECDRELAREELERSIEVVTPYDVSLDSFVFPRNHVGHRDLLAEYGFTCYRGLSPVHRSGLRFTKPLRHALRGTALGNPSLLVEPAGDEYGLVDVPASLFLLSFEGAPRRVSEPLIGDLIVRKARRGIDQAARNDGVFHVWLHPNDLHTDYVLDRLETIFEYLDSRREATDLSVATMAEVADRYLAD